MRSSEVFQGGGAFQRPARLIEKTRIAIARGDVALDDRGHTAVRMRDLPLPPPRMIALTALEAAQRFPIKIGFPRERARPLTLARLQSLGHALLRHALQDLGDRR